MTIKIYSLKKFNDEYKTNLSYIDRDLLMEICDNLNLLSLNGILSINYKNLDNFLLTEKIYDRWFDLGKSNVYKYIFKIVIYNIYYDNTEYFSIAFPTNSDLNNFIKYLKLKVFI